MTQYQKTKKLKQPIKMSLRKQIVVSFLLIIFTIIGLDMLCNSLFLNSYYSKTKKEDIIDMANSLNVDLLENEAYLSDLERDCSIKNLTILVCDKSEMCYYYPTYSSDAENQLRIYMAESNKKNTVIGNIRDDKLNLSYLQVCGQKDEYCYIIRTPLESIEEFASIYTMFLLQPVKNLTKASIRIANMDFSVKCPEVGSTETMELASNFNTMSQKLERNVSDLSVANKKLEEDIKKIEQAEEMKRDFMSGISHELKTPIAIISGYAESLATFIDDPEDVKMYANTICEETDKLSYMVQQILKINKMESSSIDIKFENIKLNDTVYEILNPLEQIISDKKIKIENRISKNAYVKTDKSLFVQILSNYITNAIDYTENGGKIIISCTPINGQKYKITVYNSGSNIPDEYSDKIWDKFFKVDTSRNRKFGGTGLGLAIVKAFSTVLGQDYGFTNKQNGVEFYVTADRP